MGMAMGQDPEVLHTVCTWINASATKPVRNCAISEHVVQQAAGPLLVPCRRALPAFAPTRCMSTHHRIWDDLQASDALMNAFGHACTHAPT